MAKLRVEVVRAWPGRVELLELQLAEGATLRSALDVAGMAAPHGAGIHGRRVPLDTKLADGDRVEVYRPLQADPRAARRRRALRRKR